MHRWLRPLLLTCLVSFFLGIWFSLQKAETKIFSRLKTLPHFKLLTDQPEWWQPIAEAARQEGVVELELLSPKRHEWEGLMRSDHGGCHLVALKSYFERYFVGNEVILPFPSALESHWDQIHPDFRSGNRPYHSLPLLWSVAGWQPNSETMGGGDSRLRIRTSPDEALLLAYDLSLIANPESMDEGEDLDWPTVAKEAWNQLKNQVVFEFSRLETAIPLFPVKGTQIYASEDKDTAGIQTLPNSKENVLWTYGLSLCRTPVATEHLDRFFQWLLQAETLRQLVQQSELGGTASALDHVDLPPAQQPSGLRRFSLARLRHRELTWPMAAAWYDLLGREEP